MNINISIRYKQYVGDAAISKIIGMPKELYQMLSNAQTMQELAESEKARIKVRTSMGVDYLNNAFAPYSKSTQKQKIKKGRFGGVVNLIDSGNMLGAIHDEKNTGDMIEFGQERIGKVFFRTNLSAMKAGYHNTGTRRMPARPFFQVSPNDEDNFVAILEKKITEWEVKNG